VTIIVWAGLTNLQATFTSLIMDIINAPAETRIALTKDLTLLDPASLSTFPKSPQPDPKNTWTPLRAAMFESIRLSGPITGPARICLEDVILPSSSPSDRQMLPKSQVATLSAYHTNRSPSVYGDDAAKWDPTRFLKSDPEIGSVKFITWGLKGPHMCPGRWFAQECLLVMTRCLLGKYDIVPDSVMSDDEKYTYSAGSVTRKDVGVTVRGRK
jgi:peroxidase